MALPVTAKLGTVAIPLTVVYAGEAPGYTKSLQQINLLLPADAPSGAQQLVLTVGTAQTQSGITLRIGAAASN